MRHVAYGRNLYHEFSEGTIFYSSDQDILKLNQNVLKDFAKVKGSKGNRYEQMKSIFLKHVLYYFKKVHYKKMMASTGLEDNDGLAMKFYHIVEKTIGRVFRSKGTVHFKITKEVVQNFEKEFKNILTEKQKTLRKTYDEASGKIDEVIKKAEKIDELINKIAQIKDERLRKRALKMFNEKFLKFGGNKSAKRINTVKELRDMLNDKSNFKNIVGTKKFSNRVVGRARKTLDALNKAKGYVDKADFFYKAYKLKNSETDDNVQYFLDVKDMFNTAGDFLIDGTPDIPVVKDFLEFYNDSFKIVDKGLNIVAKHVREIEGQIDNLEKQRVGQKVGGVLGERRILSNPGYDANKDHRKD